MATQGEMPVVLSSNLRVQERKDPSLFVMLSRWKKRGRLMSLKRGVYLIAPPYRKAPVHEFYLSQVLESPSYISLEKALEFHGLIPEGVPVFTSVTTKHPRIYDTAVGTFRYFHLHHRLFWGYEPVEQNRQTGFVARPEKALLDFFYLHHIEGSPSYLTEMRLQNLERLNLKTLRQCAERFNKTWLTRTADKAIRFLTLEKSKEKIL